MMTFSDKISIVLEALRVGFYDEPGGLTYDEDEANDSFGAETMGYLSYKIHVMYRKGSVSCFLAYGKCEIPVGPAERPLSELESLLAAVKAELRLRLGCKFAPRDIPWDDVSLDPRIPDEIPMDVAADNLTRVLQRCFGGYVSDACRELNNLRCYGRYYTLYFNLYDTYPVSISGDYINMCASFTCLEIDGDGEISFFMYDYDDNHNVESSIDNFEHDRFVLELKREVESRLPDKFLRQRAAASEAPALMTSPGDEAVPSGPKEFKRAAEAFFGNRFADGHACWGEECHRLLHPVGEVGNRRAYGLFNPPPELAEELVASYRAFAVRFSAYATVPVVLACREGMLDAYLYYGKYLVPINPRRLPMPASRMTEFFRLVKEELELRLPDEFLAKYGWLE